MCGGYGTERDGKLHDGATWRCDTIEVWMKGRSTVPTALWEEFDKNGYLERLRRGAHLVITGGEPLMQQKSLVGFLEFLEEEYDVRPIIEVETNATVIPIEELDRRVSYWNTSPKLSNSGMPRHERILEDVLRWFAASPKTMSKFVLGRPEDWQEIENDFLQPQLVNREQLVLMPAAGSREELLKNNLLVANICISEGIRMCSRLHVEIWDKLTGV